MFVVTKTGYFSQEIGHLPAVFLATNTDVL